VYSIFWFIDCELLLATASQAYVERTFSLCGFLTTTGRRNCMQQVVVVSHYRKFILISSQIVCFGECMLQFTKTTNDS